MVHTAANLRAEILALFATGVDSALPDATFDRLARASFELQYNQNIPFAKYCERRGISPATIGDWSHIPVVPTAAFKEVALIVGGPEDAQVIFRTSGTTLGNEKRGSHYIRDLSLYHGALLPMFEAYLLPDGARTPFLSLVPDVRALPDSSLSHMIDVAARRLSSGGTSFMDAVHGLADEDLERALDRHSAAGQPVVLLGTSFAFVHWLESMTARNKRFTLPAGSRLMDTGGYKGKSRVVPAAELRSAYGERLGIPPSHCVNEYGMTELCSQFYDRALRFDAAGRGGAAVVRRPAPWVRTRVVNPETLEPLPPGQVGILQHFDLANLYSVTAVQTEDLGRAADDGFELLGRAEGAQPRGCSIAMDLLLQANSTRQ